MSDTDLEETKPEGREELFAAVVKNFTTVFKSLEICDQWQMFATEWADRFYKACERNK